jgi:hypothetical protein
VSAIAPAAARLAAAKASTNEARITEVAVRASRLLPILLSIQHAFYQAYLSG